MIAICMIQTFWLVMFSFTLNKSLELTLTSSSGIVIAISCCCTDAEIPEKEMLLESFPIYK